MGTTMGRRMGVRRLRTSQHDEYHNDASTSSTTASSSRHDRERGVPNGSRSANANPCRTAAGRRRRIDGGSGS